MSLSLPRAAEMALLRRVLLLSLAALVVETLGGVYAGSLALLADAGHAAMDVVALGMTLLAVRLAARPPSGRWTFGLLRLEVLAAFLDAVLLVAIGALIVVGGIDRLFNEPTLATAPMLLTALVALLIEVAAAVLLHGADHGRLHLRAAYLDVVGDIGGSASALVAAVIIALTGWRPADVVASLVIGALILARTWGLLGEASAVLLEGTPPGVDLTVVRHHILTAPGVVGCHDVHAWSISSGLPAVSAHVVLADGAEPTEILAALSDCLASDFDIEHSTFQLESVDRRPLELHGHA